MSGTELCAAWWVFGLLACLDEWGREDGLCVLIVLFYYDDHAQAKILSCRDNIG